MSCGTATTGAKSQRIPVAAVSGGRRPADLLDKRRVARRPEPDVVREDRGAGDIVVAVDGVDAVEDRDPEPRLDGGLPGRRRPSRASRPACSRRGVPPPPLRTPPTDGVPRRRPASIEPFSTSVIWPIFSASVISARRPATRSSIGRDGSRHAAPAGVAGSPTPQRRRSRRPAMRWAATNRTPRRPGRGRARAGVGVGCRRSRRCVPRRTPPSYDRRATSIAIARRADRLGASRDFIARRSPRDQRALDTLVGQKALLQGDRRPGSRRWMTGSLRSVPSG